MADPDYAAWEPDDLLMGLELAGPSPPPSLVEACTAHHEALAPTLRAWFGAYDSDTFGDDDDPRWYRPVHAGMLLAYARDAEALDVFERMLGDLNDDMNDWYDGIVSAAYSIEVRPLAEAFLARSPDDWGYAAAFGLLGDTGRLRTTSDADRAALAERIAAELPALRPDGAPDLPDDFDAEGDARVYAWTRAISALMDLRSRVAEDRVRALFERDLYDPTLFGDADRYEAALAAPVEVVEPFDVVGYYAGTWRSRDGWPSAWVEADRARLAEMEHDLLYGEEHQVLRFLLALADAAGYDPEETAAMIAGIESEEDGEDLLERLAEEVHPDDFQDLVEEFGPSFGYEPDGAPTRTVHYDQPKVGRNAPCPCGSGKKYKKCHGRA